MTAKEQLLERVTKLSEEEAEETLRLLEAQEDPMIRMLEDAPLEDEEISVEEEAAVQEARDELAAGAPTIPFDEVKRKYGLS
ncbi:MAG TPA: hypothetical protein VHU86_04395 [Solirubrobacterales bacterium]|jgi:hypothetical protein|nr:hypothetical protein [Solirubrobacterales bacterium]